MKLHSDVLRVVWDKMENGIYIPEKKRRDKYEFKMNEMIERISSTNFVFGIGIISMNAK